MSSLYQIRTEKDCYRIVKFDDNITLSIVAIYYIWKTKRNRLTCSCPAGGGPMCRHRDTILQLFHQAQHINDGWFLRYYDENHYQWERPINSPARLMEKKHA